MKKLWNLTHPYRYWLQRALMGGAALADCAPQLNQLIEQLKRKDIETTCNVVETMAAEVAGSVALAAKYVQALRALQSCGSVVVNGYRVTDQANNGQPVTVAQSFSVEPGARQEVLLEPPQTPITIDNVAIHGAPAVFLQYVDLANRVYLEGQRSRPADATSRVGGARVVAIGDLWEPSKALRVQVESMFL